VTRRAQAWLVLIALFITTIAVVAAKAQVLPEVRAVQQDSTVLILGLAATVAGVLTAMISGVVAVLINKLNHKADLAASHVAAVAAQTGVAAARVQEVKVDLHKANGVTNEKLDEIHTLVNSNLERSLKISALALRRVADLTGHAGDAEAAKVAEEALAEHQRKQKVVDEGMASVGKTPKGTA
jgi:hypothetical protein